MYWTFWWVAKNHQKCLLRTTEPEAISIICNFWWVAFKSHLNRQGRIVHEKLQIQRIYDRKIYLALRLVSYFGLNFYFFLISFSKMSRFFVKTWRWIRFVGHTYLQGFLCSVLTHGRPRCWCLQWRSVLCSRCLAPWSRLGTVLSRRQQCLKKRQQETPPRISASTSQGLLGPLRQVGAYSYNQTNVDI